MVAGSPGKGRLWRHDPTERPEVFGDALVSCTGSLEIVDLPRAGEQLALRLGPGIDEEAGEDAGDQADPAIGTIALF
jgi:hypothetical protein